MASLHLTSSSGPAAVAAAVKAMAMAVERQHAAATGVVVADVVLFASMMVMPLLWQ